MFWFIQNSTFLHQVEAITPEGRRSSHCCSQLTLSPLGPVPGYCLWLTLPQRRSGLQSPGAGVR